MPLRARAPASTNMQTLAQNYAKRFPKTNTAGGNAIDKLERKVQHETCVAVVEQMVLDPSLGSAIKNYLEQRRKQEESKQEETNGRFHHTYCYYEKISKEWMAQWLVMASQGGPHKIAMELLNKVDMQNIMDMRRLFYLVCGISGMTKLPRECLDKETCSKTMLRRCEELGRRIDKVSGCISASGIVDWARLGVYKITFNATTGKGASIEREPVRRFRTTSSSTELRYHRQRQRRLRRGRQGCRPLSPAGVLPEELPGVAAPIGQEGFALAGIGAAG